MYNGSGIIKFLASLPFDENSRHLLTSMDHNNTNITLNNLTVRVSIFFSMQIRGQDLIILPEEL